MTVYYKNKQDFLKKIENIENKNIWFIFDFDWTITQNNTMTSFWAISSLLPEWYNIRRKELFDKYYNIERDLTYPEDKKREKMREWWENVFYNMKNFWFSKEIEDKVSEVAKEKVFRKDFLSILKKLNAKKIDSIIFSAWYTASIKWFLEYKTWWLDSHIKIIANVLDFLEDGTFTWKAKEPLIFPWNKSMEILDKKLLKTFFDKDIVFVFWDNFHDYEMYENENAIKIIFLHWDWKDDIDMFWEKFDVVIDSKDCDKGFISTLL